MIKDLDIIGKEDEMFHTGSIEEKINEIIKVINNLKLLIDKSEENIKEFTKI
jgi:hypothetical protein